MRILAFSDLHRDKDIAATIVTASTEADVVIGAGDFATKGLGLSDTFDILKKLAMPTIFVCGNHDDPAELATACRGHEHIRILHGQSLHINGVTFFGMGLEAPVSNNEPWNQGLTEEQAAMLLASCPPGAVLVTHAPPFGVADLQTTGIHEGSKAIRTAIETAQPVLHLCGHIHHAWGSKGFIGQCPVHNLGPSLNWFTV